MITNISLRNFKCFRELEVNPKLITVFIGPNGTGKSSVLQALLLLKQSLGTDQINYQGEFINLSAPADLVPNFLSEPLPTYLELKGGKVTEATQEVDEFQFAAEFTSNLRLFSPGNLEDPTQTGVPGKFAPVGLVLNRLAIVPAVRGLVRPRYELGANYSEQVPLHRGLSGQEEQLATNLGYSRSLEEKLSTLLQKVTGTGLRADVVPSNSVEVKSMTPSGAVNMVAAGFGSNALILLLHQLISAEKGATVLIEEPEIHLHPKAQADLAQVLAETAVADGKQVIMTTHSEHLLSRLLTLVAEKRLYPDQLAIYSFEKDGEGECSASEIEVTERGQVTGGLTGFFDANLAEMDRYVKALQTKS